MRIGHLDIPSNNRYAVHATPAPSYADIVNSSWHSTDLGTIKLHLKMGLTLGRTRRWQLSVIAELHGR